MGQISEHRKTMSGSNGLLYHFLGDTMRVFFEKCLIGLKIEQFISKKTAKICDNSI